MVLLELEEENKRKLVLLERKEDKKENVETIKIERTLRKESRDGSVRVRGRE
jgi:hypothetical protein